MRDSEMDSAAVHHIEPEVRTETTPAAPMLWHDYANLFPLLEGEAYRALLEDIRANGVHEPVVMFDGKVLDGRNRYLAARECGQPYPVTEYTGDDPLAYVISLNLKRRHLSESQRASVAAKIAKLPVGANQHTEISAPSQAEAAAMLKVSPDSVQFARRVQEDGVPELGVMVDSGVASVSAAAEVARLPAPRQAEIVAAGPAAVKAAAKESRETRKVKPPQPEAAAPELPTEAAAGEDKERRKIARLTPDAMVDEILGLRADLAFAAAKINTLSAERDDLKAKLKEATSSDMGRSLGNAQRRADTATGRMNEFMAQVKRLEYRLKKAEARVKELEEMEVIPA